MYGDGALESSAYRRPKKDPAFKRSRHDVRAKGLSSFLSLARGGITELEFVLDAGGGWFAGFPLLSNRRPGERRSARSHLAYGHFSHAYEKRSLGGDRDRITHRESKKELPTTQDRGLMMR